MPDPAKSASRPDIEQISTGGELRRWYWRKDELVAYARKVGVKRTSGKFVILDRLAHFLDTGQTVYPGDQSVTATSKFDWHTEALTPDTILTDSYKNTQNVRRFFRAQLGDSFKFNIAFMEWMKSNTGKPLRDACTAYLEHKAAQQTDGHQTQIKDHNQFNQYTRDFLADNPTLGMSDVRKVWALKIQLPSESGRHVYEPSDLDLTGQG